MLKSFIGEIQMRGNYLVGILFCLLLICSIDRGFAQTLDMQSIPGDRAQIGINFDKAFYSSKYEATTGSGILRLSLNIPVSSKFNLIGYIPYANTSYKTNYYYGVYAHDEKGIGNIFIGLQSNKMPVNNKRTVVTFGVYLPTVSQSTGYLGSLANYYYSQEFFPDMVGVYFNYAYHKIITEGFSWGLELGPNFYISTDSRYRKTNLTLHYGFGAGYGFSDISLKAEILGIALLTGNANSLGNIFAHLLDLGAQWNGSVIIPKLFYRVYLSDNLKYFAKGSLGIGVSVIIN